MKVLCTIFFLLSSFIVRCQDISNLQNRNDTIEVLKKLIEKSGEVSSIGIDFAGTPSTQYYRFAFLLTILDNDDLIKLVNKSKGCLRTYAYIGLYHNKYPKINEIAALLISDSTKITTVSGDVWEEYTVGNIITKVENWYWEAQTNQLLVKLENDFDFRKKVFENILKL